MKFRFQIGSRHASRKYSILKLLFRLYCNKRQTRSKRNFFNFEWLIKINHLMEYLTIALFRNPYYLMRTRFLSFKSIFICPYFTYT